MLLTGCGNKKNDGVKSDKTDVSDYTLLKDDEFLVKVGEFEREGNSNTVLYFDSLTDGRISNDGDSTVYKMNWNLYGNKLIINIDWVYSKKKEYIIKIDKENIILTLNNEIKYVKKGSQVKEEVEHNNLSLLKGAWHEMTDKGDYMWYFDSTWCYVGYYSEKMYVSKKYEWNIKDDYLELIDLSGEKEVYKYLVEGKKLMVYKDDNIIYSFDKSNYNMEK